MIQKQIPEVLSHLNPLKTYFCGENLSWINIFSEVVIFLFYYKAIFSVRIFRTTYNVKNPSNWQRSIPVFTLKRTKRQAVLSKTKPDTRPLYLLNVCFKSNTVRDFFKLPLFDKNHFLMKSASYHLVPFC